MTGAGVETRSPDTVLQDVSMGKCISVWVSLNACGARFTVALILERWTSSCEWIAARRRDAYDEGTHLYTSLLVGRTQADTMRSYLMQAGYGALWWVAYMIW